MSWPEQSGNRIKQTYIQGFLDISGGDVNIRNNGSLYVGNNTSIGGNTIIDGNTSIGGNTNISGNTVLNKSVTSGNNIIPIYDYLFDVSCNHNYQGRDNSNYIQIIPAPAFFTSNNLDIYDNSVDGYQYENISFKNGSYDASCSSYYDTNSQAYNAFNGSTSINKCWSSAKNSFSTTGKYTGTNKVNISSTTTPYTISGEWLQISLPHYLIINAFSIAYVNNNSDVSGSPNHFYVLGSNTLNSWTILYDVSNTTSPFQSSYITNYTIQNPNLSSFSFNNIMLLVNSTYNSTNVTINQFNLYGFPYISNMNTNPYPYYEWFNYGTSIYDLLDSSFSSISNNSVSGLNSNSFNLNNTNYLVLPTLSLYNNSTGFFICFWIKNLITPTFKNTLFEFNSLNSSFSVQYDATKIYIIVKNVIIYSSNTTIITNTINWNHLCFSFLPTSISIYLNGLLYDNISITNSYINEDYVVNYVGRSNAGKPPYGNFYITDFRVYTNSTNAFLINSIYNATNNLYINNLLSYHFNNAYFGNNVNIYYVLSLN